MQTFNFIQYADQYSICRPPVPFFSKLGDDFTTKNNNVWFWHFPVSRWISISTIDPNKNSYVKFWLWMKITGTVSQNLLTITGTVSQNLLTRATHTWMGLQLASLYIFIQHFDAFLSWVISLVHNCSINFIAYIFGTIFPLDFDFLQ